MPCASLFNHVSEGSRYADESATKRKHVRKLDQLDERIGDTLVSGVRVVCDLGTSRQVSALLRRAPPRVTGPTSATTTREDPHHSPIDPRSGSWSNARRLARMLARRAHETDAVVLALDNDRCVCCSRNAVRCANG